MSWRIGPDQCADCRGPLEPKRRYCCDRCVLAAIAQVRRNVEGGDTGPIGWTDEPRPPRTNAPATEGTERP